MHLQFPEPYKTNFQTSLTFTSLLSTFTPQNKSSLRNLQNFPNIPNYKRLFPNFINTYPPLYLLLIETNPHDRKLRSPGPMNRTITGRWRKISKHGTYLEVGRWAKGLFEDRRWPYKALFASVADLSSGSPWRMNFADSASSTSLLYSQGSATRNSPNAPLLSCSTTPLYVSSPLVRALHTI